MHHQVFGRKLNRGMNERKALFKSLVLSLIRFGKIKTTLAKAKAIHGLADKLVTKAKDGGDNAKKQLYAFLAQKQAVDTLIEKVAPVFKDTLGGYVRIRRTGVRKGDGSEEVVLEWSKQPEVKNTKGKEKSVKQDIKTVQRKKKV